MGVKEPGSPPKTHAEILKMVEEGMAVESSKLFNKSSPFRLRPPYNHHAQTHMSFAPWYPEMNQVGYDHKVHGTMVVPDYRVYKLDRAVNSNEYLNKYVQNLELDGLKDPWLRNEVWRVDPHCGKDTAVGSIRKLLTRGMLLGLGLAATHFVLRKAYDYAFPPHHFVTDKWWELRETPNPNVIKNRVQPFRYICGWNIISENPKLARFADEDYGLPNPPPIPWYDKNNDPNLVC